LPRGKTFPGSLFHRTNILPSRRRFGIPHKKWSCRLLLLLQGYCDTSSYKVSRFNHNKRPRSYRTLSTITKTTTVTTTSTTDIAPDVPNYLTGPYKHDIKLIGARQETAFPTNTPAYASVCSGTSRYSSACSCVGAKATTTTVSNQPHCTIS
jgi:hypothetical protein